MGISSSTKIFIMMIALLSCTLLFAQEPDWRTQNAVLEEQHANTANTNANTAALNANTAAVNASTAATPPNTISNISIEMVTPVPAPKEKTVVPQGFVNCFMIKAGWFNGVWIPEHRVCQYTQSTEGVAWIDGYWACAKYKTTKNNSGVCSSWNWKPGHWVSKFDLY